MWISCDWCKVWYHAACDNIGKVALKKMSRENQKYACFACRPTLAPEAYFAPPDASSSSAAIVAPSAEDDGRRKRKREDN